MGILDRFESRLDRLVNGAFARAFKAEVQPVEIASALQREMDDRAAIVSRARTVVPNVFGVDLAPHDHERLAVYAEPLQGELADMVREYAEEQRYTFLGGVDVVLDVDPELETGIFRVRSEAKPEVSAVPRPNAAQQNRAQGAVGGQGRLLIEGTAYPLTRALTRLGRGTEVDIRIDDPGVSRVHAEIVLGQPPLLRDLSSTNGTMLNGHPVTEAPLTDGDHLLVGATTITFRSG